MSVLDSTFLSKKLCGEGALLKEYSYIGFFWCESVPLGDFPQSLIDPRLEILNGAFCEVKSAHWEKTILRYCVSALLMLQLRYVKTEMATNKDINHSTPSLK